MTLLEHLHLVRKCVSPNSVDELLDLAHHLEDLGLALLFLVSADFLLFSEYLKVLLTSCKHVSMDVQVDII